MKTKNVNWKPHHVTCPKCGKSHHIFDGASPSSHVRYATCGQAYHMNGGPVEPATTDSFGRPCWRPVQITRALPVRELSQEECGRLLVHNHITYTDDISREMRRKAYLLKSAGDNWTVYFNGTEASQIQQWIESEKPLMMKAA